MASRYSAEFRKQCVDAVLELGKTRTEVAQEYGISDSTLGRWVAKEQGTLGTGSGSHMRKADPNSTDPAEMAKRIAELERENEFLRKAAVFFTKEN
ncbi:transposase [Corynebacterium yudongzhengii]|uniref:transposase n=1 Tax=Corynebacterium yudongzhengii TaxID=2080740 RepID=UPI001F232AC1|nr:transposase [Corynebacterium yudongzhengii]